MNDDNTRKLFKRFKFLNKKNMPEGFQCGDGWYTLIYNMCKELKDADPPDNFYITHIGEKYNELDVHTKNGVMRTRVVIDDFNTASLDICDNCGNDRDLEMCDKCTVPVIEYPDPEPENEEEDDSNTNSGCGSCSSCGSP